VCERERVAEDWCDDEEESESERAEEGVVRLLRLLKAIGECSQKRFNAVQFEEASQFLHSYACV
jgi:hypothetical protein